CRRKDTGEKRAERSTHSVNAKRIKRIVIAKPGLEFCACKKRKNSSRNPDHYRAARSDISTSRCNHDQPGHGTRAKPEHARFTAQRILEHGPCERGNRRCKCGGRKRVCRDSIRRKRATRVKAVPAYPEQPRSHHAKHTAVRGHD